LEYIYLFFISFLSATILPLGSEVYFLHLLNSQFYLPILLLFATLGNTLGSVVNYFIGIKGEEYLEEKKYIKKESGLKYKYYFEKFGGYLLLLSWVPIVGDPITLIAGALKYNFKRFLILVLFAKFVRYLFVALTFLYFN